MLMIYVIKFVRYFCMCISFRHVLQTFHSDWIQMFHSDVPFGRSIQTFHSDVPFGRSIRTFHSDVAFRRSIHTIHSGVPFGRSRQTFHLDVPCGRSIRTFHSDVPFVLSRCASSPSRRMAPTRRALGWPAWRYKWSRSTRRAPSTWTTFLQRSLHGSIR